MRKKRESMGVEMKERRKGEMKEIHHEFRMSTLDSIGMCAFLHLQSTGLADKELYQKPDILSMYW